MTKPMRAPQKPKEFQERKYREDPGWKPHHPRQYSKKVKHPNRIYDEL